ncbi:APC family permease [Lapillicoccus jejuensis]|uniref:Amino acid/polyamine/organocation transporter (APC superfamily) n=1 Tax=Lapillicoccus jejuensis TaxID=402171 RepID=A0A542E336_9MICO|nr:APC family permease [Lapillicoccus jejuensis]TQJ09742.1 amino acid/polyamine/organocation transporter (APC superfamily) [Lapillicoccus jejuensis]
MATTTSSPPQSESPNLKRHVGVVGLLFASVGSIIGSGWLFGALNASQQAGPAAVISWALGGILILFIALCYAELGTMFPLSGGVVRFPHMAFGNFASFTSGWITYIAVGTTAPIEVEAALQYGTKYADFTTKHTVGGDTVYTLTPLGYGAAVVLMALFVVVNYFGVRWFARINNALVSWKLFIILLVIVAFFVAAFHGSNFTSYGFTPQGVHGVFTAIATSGIVFSYLGFRQGIELAGETDNPKRNVPLAVIGSVLLTAVIYILLQVAFIGALDPGTLSGSGGWANLAFKNDFGPLAALASLLGLGWLAVLLYVDAIVSPGDTGLIYTTVTSRISFAMARNGNAPKALGRTTDRGAPLIGLLLAFVIGLIAFLPFPSWQQLVGFITSATVLSFASGPLVLVALRRQIPDRERPFRLPGGHVIPFLAFWGSNLIVYWSGWQTVWKLMVAVLIGFVLLAIFMATGVLRGQSLDARAGLWVVPWLAGMTIMSYLGDYDGGLKVVGFGTAIPIVGLLSALIYVMAYRLRLPDEAARAYIEETVQEAAVEDEQLAAH